MCSLVPISSCIFFMAELLYTAEYHRYLKDIVIIPTVSHWEVIPKSCKRATWFIYFTYTLLWVRLFTHLNMLCKFFCSLWGFSDWLREPHFKFISSFYLISPVGFLIEITKLKWQTGTLVAMVSNFPLLSHYSGNAAAVQRVKVKS